MLYTILMVIFFASLAIALFAFVKLIVNLLRR